MEALYSNTRNEVIKVFGRDARGRPQPSHLKNTSCTKSRHFLILGIQEESEFRVCGVEIKQAGDYTIMVTREQTSRKLNTKHLGTGRSKQADESATEAEKAQFMSDGWSQKLPPWRQHVAECIPFPCGIRHPLVQQNIEIHHKRPDGWAYSHSYPCRLAVLQTLRMCKSELSTAPSRLNPTSPTTLFRPQICYGSASLMCTDTWTTQSGRVPQQFQSVWCADCQSCYVWLQKTHCQDGGRTIVLASNTHRFDCVCGSRVVAATQSTYAGGSA